MRKTKESNKIKYLIVNSSEINKLNDSLIAPVYSSSIQLSYDSMIQS